MTYPSKVRYTFKQNAVEVEYTISNPKEINTIDIYGMVPWFVKSSFIYIIFMNIMPIAAMQKYMNGLGLLERRCGLAGVWYGLAGGKMFYECMNVKIFFRIWINICLRVGQPHQIFFSTKNTKLYVNYK